MFASVIEWLERKLGSYLGTKTILSIFVLPDPNRNNTLWDQWAKVLASQRDDVSQTPEPCLKRRIRGSDKLVSSQQSYYKMESKQQNLLEAQGQLA